MVNSVKAIVFGYNSAERIEKVLTCLLNQNIPDDVAFSILIMTNAENDNTKQRAEEFWIKQNSSINLAFIHEPKPGLIHSREAAIANSNEDVLVFVDDDNYLDKDYITGAISVLNTNPEVAIVCGNNHPYFKISPPDWYLQHIKVLAAGYQGDMTGDITEKKGFAWGAGMVVRNRLLKQLFNAGFGFTKITKDNKLMPFADDTELSYMMRLAGYKIFYNEKMHLEHEVPEFKVTEKYLIEISYAQGFSSVILDPFFYYFKKGFYTKHQIKIIWLKEVFYCYKRLYNTNKATISLSRMLTRNYYKGRLKHLIDFRKNYYDQFKKISSVKNQLSSFQ